MKSSNLILPAFIACLISILPSTALSNKHEFGMRVQDNSVPDARDVYIYQAYDLSIPHRKGWSEAGSGVNTVNFRCDIDDGGQTFEPNAPDPTCQMIVPGSYYLRIGNHCVLLEIKPWEFPNNDRDFQLKFDGTNFSRDSGNRFVLGTTRTWTETTADVFIDQQLSDNNTVGVIKRYDEYAEVPAFVDLGASIPVTMPITVGSSQIFLGDQSIYSNQKYNNWSDLADVTNHHSFDIAAGQQSLISFFLAVYSTATITSSLLDAPSIVGDSVDFKDPWFIDHVDAGHGSQLQNQGLSAAFRRRGCPFFPDISTSYDNNCRYLGVFLNQNPDWLPEVPNYSVSAPTPDTISGYRSHFVNWGTSGAEVQDVNASSTGVVFTSSEGATVTAHYKAHMGSSIPGATGANGQRKIGYINGRYHMVYESAGEIWAVSSTDNGANWSTEVRLSDGTGRSRQPSLAINQTYTPRNYQNPDGNLYRIGCVWEYVNGEISSIEVRRSDGEGTWTTEETLTAFMVPVTGGSTPVMTMENECETIVWKGAEDGGNQGLFVIALIPTSEPEGYDMFPYSLIPGTSSSSVHPTSATIAYYESIGEFAVAWSQAGEVYYKRCQVDFQGREVNFSPTEWASQGHSSSYTTHDHPSLVFEQNLTVRPVCAWQAHFHNEAVDYECVLTRRRESSGWSGALLTIYSVNGEDAEKPSVMRASDASTNLNLAFHASNSSVYTAKYRSGSWGAKSALSGVQGAYASLGHSGAGTSMYRTAYTGLTSIYSIGTSGEGLSKAGGEDTEKLTRMIVASDARLTSGSAFSYSIGLSSVKMQAPALEANDLALGSFSDTVCFATAEEARGFLTTETFAYEVGKTLSFEAQLGQCGGTDVEEGAVGLRCLVLDSRSGKEYTSLPLDTLRLTQSARSKTQVYSLSLGTLPGLVSGTSVRLALDVDLPPAAAGATRFTPVIVHESQSSGSAIAKELWEKGKAVTIGQELPTTYVLSEAYPNPFNPSTTLHLGLPADGHVHLTIFDALGREVTRLQDGSLPSGYHCYTWNAAGMASGLYFARLEVADALGRSAFRKTHKLVLTK